MAPKAGDRICVATGDGEIVCVYVRRVEHGHTKMLGGEIILIQYGPQLGKLGPNEVEGTVFIEDQGITWDLGWEAETQQALAAASALTGESAHDFNDIDLTEAMEGLLRRPVH